MGCEICEKSVPKDFHQCKIAQRKPFKKIYFAPCSMSFNNNSNVRGSNYTPPKKRKKRK